MNSIPSAKKITGITRRFMKVLFVKSSRLLSFIDTFFKNVILKLSASFKMFSEILLREDSS